MPSIQAYIARAIVWYRYHGRDPTVESVLERAYTNAAENARSEVVPPAIERDAQVATEREEWELQSEVVVGNAKVACSEKWDVIHCSPTAGTKGDKVVVYFHGGAFINRASPEHWTALINKAAKEAGTPVIVLHFPLAPYSTADMFDGSVLAFLERLLGEERYAGKQLVLMGDSAGGWMALRAYQAVLQVALGRHRVRRSDEDRMWAQRAAKERLPAVIIISGVIDMEVREDFQDGGAREDPWLTETLWRGMGPLWCYGPRAFPDSRLSSLVSDSALPARLHATASQRPLSEPTFSLNNNVELFADAHREVGTRPVVLGLQGTHDACYGGMRDLFARLGKLGGEVVRSELVVEQGLFHVYPLVTVLPEAQRAWKRIFEVIA